MQIAPDFDAGGEKDLGSGETSEAPIAQLKVYEAQPSFESSYTLATDEGTFCDDASCPEARGKALERRERRIQVKIRRGCPVCPEPVINIRYYCGLVATDKRFKRLILALIVINSLMMGLATFDFVEENSKVWGVFERFDTAFLVVFTVELALNLAYQGLGIFRSGWHTFDFVVVTLSWMFSSFTIIRSFRCLRLITHVKSLQDLVAALFNVLPRMFGIGLLLVLVFYVFAVMFTSLFKDYYEEGYTSQDYFGRLDRTCLTLFQIMTLDDWSAITKELMAGNRWAWVPMIVFVSISSFVFINLIIAVICDAVSELQRKEIEEEVINKIESNEFAGGEATNDVAQDVQRLEMKVDELSNLVKMLLQNQQQQQLDITQTYDATSCQPLHG